VKFIAVLAVGMRLFSFTFCPLIVVVTLPIVHPFSQKSEALPEVREFKFQLVV